MSIGGSTTNYSMFVLSLFLSASLVLIIIVCYIIFNLSVLLLGVFLKKWSDGTPCETNGRLCLALSCDVSSKWLTI